eukprot:CCRYP_020834-RA/>CCRYP_020834-RA protein AED:0.37 eAED:0.22 QI:0/0/0/0.66/1/1/3/0/880
MPPVTFAPPVTVPAYVPAPMQYPSQQQYQQYTQQLYGRGRGRRSNNRRGARRNNQYAQPPSMAVPPAPSAGGYIPPPTIPSTGTIDKPAFSNTTKYYNNWNMCYSCGWDVPQWHTSQTCNNRVPGHQEGCNRANAQAYMTAGHRVSQSEIVNLTAFKDKKSIPIPVQSKPLENYYNILLDSPSSEREDDDDKTVITSNRSCKHDCDNATTTTAALTGDNLSSDEETSSKHTMPPEYAIMDSGATAHFIVKGATVKNERPTSNPLKIKLPDGSVIQSTHTCNLDIPWLPNNITEAHIVPKLAHSLLVATRKFCDAGCKIIFDVDGCRILYKGILVLSGTRDPSPGLWRVPINPASTVSIRNHLDLSRDTPHRQYAANLYTLPFKQQQLKYMHQSFFSPPTNTLIKAINNGQLEGVPFMKSDLVRKYLAPSPATSKEADSACNVFCYAALAEKHSGTMYTDATGTLPAVSLEGNQYYFIAYAYNPNYIFAIPIPNLRDETIIKAFDKVFQDLKSKGFKPMFNVTDNQAATPIKNCLRNENTTWQFVEPNNHRVNAAERAIQTYKNHFICGLCTTDSDWPLQLWDSLTEQALITLNLLRTSRIDPSKSAFQQIYGHKYDWNAHPLAPPGTKVIVYESPQGRASWGPRGLDAWYCGPAFNHYRNSKFYVPSTKAYRTSGSFDLFPQHCILPTFTRKQHMQEVYAELFESIQKLTTPAKRKFLRKVAKALDTLATAPSLNVPPSSEGEPISEVDEVDIVFQRVTAAPKVTTSNNPTDPKMVKITQRIHQRQTRTNTPGQLPAIINPDNDAPHTRRSPRLAKMDEAPIITISTPSSSRIPLHSSNIIAMHVINRLTHQVYSDPSPIWLPNSFISSSPAMINYQPST